MSFRRVERIVEVKDITIDANIAESNPEIVIPGTIADASQRTTALIIKVNNPSVRKFKGRVNKRSIGRITIFKSPKTTAASKAVVKFSILNPGTM